MRYPSSHSNRSPLPRFACHTVCTTPIAAFEMREVQLFNYALSTDCTP